MKWSILVLTLAATLPACGSDGDDDNNSSNNNNGNNNGNNNNNNSAQLGLTVKAGGTAIGHVLSLEDYVVWVVDITKGVYFGVNRQTGNVTGWAGGAWSTDSCTGGLGRLVETDAYNCNAAAMPPTLRWVWGTGATSDLGGWGQASSLQTTHGAPEVFSKAASYTDDTAECIADVNPEACGYYIIATEAIPTSFTTPITIVAE